MTRLLASAAACLALAFFAAPGIAMPVPTAPGIAPIAFDGDCGGCKGKDKNKGETKPATSSIAPVAMGDCGGCKGKDKDKGETKPATSSVAPVAMGADCGGCKGKDKGGDKGETKPATS